MAKPKPWSVKAGMAVGLVVGALLWLEAYESGHGLMQNLQLLLGPVAVGAGLVGLRNWLRQVGPFDPAIIAENKQGRV